MGEFIHISTDQDAGFDEPEPPSSRLVRITSLLNAAWDKYLTTSGDKTAIIDDLYTHTIELRETFADYSGREQDLPIEVQDALMHMRQPMLPPRIVTSPESISFNALQTSRTARRARRRRQLGEDATSRFAALRYGN